MLDIILFKYGIFILTFIAALFAFLSYWQSRSTNKKIPTQKAMEKTELAKSEGENIQLENKEKGEDAPSGVQEK